MLLFELLQVGSRVALLHPGRPSEKKKIPNYLLVGNKTKLNPKTNHSLCHQYAKHWVIKDLTGFIIQKKIQKGIKIDEMEIDNQ